MWFFSSPQIVFGDDALDYIEELRGERAFIVTDRVLAGLGYAEDIRRRFEDAGMETAIFDEVEPEPSLQTVKRGARIMADFEPDWVVGLGGGSCMDGAKAMWALYERPDMEPDEISPLVPLGIRQKARLVTIPTTSGTGSECTWMIVISDADAHRKLVLGSRELIADYALVDPAMVQRMPARLAADTGMDALAQAIESYTSTWRNEFADGLCLQATRMIFSSLRESVAGDEDARAYMHLASSISGLAMSNAQASTSHALGHPLGAFFKIPHGRAVGMFLPYTMEFSLPVSGERYADLARFVGLPGADGADGARCLIDAVRDLMHDIGQPLSAAELGIDREAYMAAIPGMIQSGENDAAASSPRVPTVQEFADLFRYAYEGRPVDF
jgi:alcohol dehydrogenase class IV